MIHYLFSHRQDKSITNMIFKIVSEMLSLNIKNKAVPLHQSRCVIYNI